MQKNSTTYIGRFAPSPTGDLHFGSLVTALASYIRARSLNGKWLLRIEDLDFLRNQKDATQNIIKTLVAHGLEWDDEIIFQSKRKEIYKEYLNILRDKKLIYVCTCTRKELLRSSKNLKTGEYIYSGCCRNKALHFNDNVSYRIKVENLDIAFNDYLQGEVTQNILHEVGDFIIWRKENFAAYQLAVVVDDALQNITEVVRGSDLFLQTPRQIYLQQVLKFNSVKYIHLPLVLNEFKQKLSKQNKAESLKNFEAKKNLKDALIFLGMNVDFMNEIYDSSSDSKSFLSEILKNFSFDGIPVANRTILKF